MKKNIIKKARQRGLVFFSIGCALSIIGCTAKVTIPVKETVIGMTGSSDIEVGSTESETTTLSVIEGEAYTIRPILPELEAKLGIKYPKKRVVVFASPDESSEKVIKLYANSSVEILGEEGIWYHVRYNGYEGYACTSLFLDQRLFYDESKIEQAPMHAENIRDLDPTKPMVALTFDDGPGKFTETVLDALSENNQRATFFVIGANIKNKEKIVQKAYNDGNQIGTHTYNHVNLKVITKEDIEWQIKASVAAIQSIVPEENIVLRLPYGSYNDVIRETVNMPMVNWSVDTEDWRLLNEEKVYEVIMNTAKDGEVLLLHDVHETSVKAAVRAIKDLTAKGIQLVTIDELAYYKGVTLKAGTVYHALH